MWSRRSHLRVGRGGFGIDVNAVNVAGNREAARRACGGFGGAGSGGGELRRRRAESPSRRGPRCSTAGRGSQLHRGPCSAVAPCRWRDPEPRRRRRSRALSRSSGGRRGLAGGCRTRGSPPWRWPRLWWLRLRRVGQGCGWGAGGGWAPVVARGVAAWSRVWSWSRVWLRARGGIRAAPSRAGRCLPRPAGELAGGELAGGEPGGACPARAGQRLPGQRLAGLIGALGAGSALRKASGGASRSGRGRGGSLGRGRGAGLTSSGGSVASAVPVRWSCAAVPCGGPVSGSRPAPRRGGSPGRRWLPGRPRPAVRRCRGRAW